MNTHFPDRSENFAAAPPEASLSTPLQVEAAAVEAVASCMLLRSLALDFSPHAASVIQDIACAGEQGLNTRGILDSISSRGVAADKLTVQKVVGYLKRSGVLRRTNGDSIATSYALDTEAAVRHREANVERLEQAKEIRGILDDWAMDLFVRRLEHEYTNEITMKKYAPVLQNLRTNAGWPTPYHRLLPQEFQQVNMIRIMQDIAEVLPDGVIRVVDSQKRMKFLFDYETILGLSPDVFMTNLDDPDCFAEPFINLSQQFLREYKLHSPVAVHMVALLSSRPDGSTRSEIARTLAKAGMPSTEQARYELSHRMKKHGILVESQCSDVLKSNTLSMHPSVQPKLEALGMFAI